MTPAGVRALLIDGLGTLIALAPPGPLLASALHRDHGIELSPSQANRAFALEMAYYRAHHQEACDDASLQELRRRCARVLAEALPTEVASALGEDRLRELMLESLRFSAEPDATQALTALRARGMGLIAVSNWDCGLAQVLRRIGLLEHLDGVVSAGEVGYRKPHPKIFRAALERARVRAEEAVHVGDSIDDDVRGALAAGIAAILLRRDRRGAERAPTLVPTVPVIGSLDELPSAIARARRLRSQQ